MKANRDPDRAAREKQAYDETDVDRKNNLIHGMFAHVRNSPNTNRGMSHYDKLIAEFIPGNDVLEIGCGRGYLCNQILDKGARKVTGIDISAEMLKEAKKLENDQLKFFEKDIHEGIDGTFDLIFGRAVLHHVDFESVLPKLYRDNLKPGGRMVFVEPLGENILLRLYWKFGTQYHTPDERPFMYRDIRWLDKALPGFNFYPINYLTIPIGVLSSVIFRSPRNWLLNLTDKIDEIARRRMSFLGPRFRSGILSFDKPETPSIERNSPS